MTGILDHDDALRQAESRFAALEHDRMFGGALSVRPVDYNILATYPPLAAMTPTTPDEAYAGLRERSRVYVHIPFCEQYCTFCHYTKEINPAAERVERYLDHLLAELDMVADRVSGRTAISSYFFGGGTPSYLSPAQLDRLLTRLHARLPLAEDGEIFFELHPSMAKHRGFEDRLDVLRTHGVRRLVFGVQSMDDRILAKLNRGHTRADVLHLIGLLRARGLDDFSADLILGLPMQTTRTLHRSLSDLIDAGTPKFNVFPLMLKRTDPIYGHYLKQPDLFPDDRTRLVMHHLAEAVVEAAGFRKGPILYYSRGPHALPPLADRSALPADVEGVDLIPLGVSAFGFVGHTQFFNECDIGRYMAAVAAGRPPVWRGIDLDEDERRRRAIMFGLRSRGIDGHAFRARFGLTPREAYPEIFGMLADHGLAAETDEHYALTPLGQQDAASVAAVFASPAIRAAAEAALRGESEDRTLMEKHNFTPIGHAERLKERQGRLRA